MLARLRWDAVRSPQEWVKTHCERATIGRTDLADSGLLKTSHPTLRYHCAPLLEGTYFTFLFARKNNVMPFG